MKAVLDSCVALKWVLAETELPIALRLRTDFLAGTNDLIAPTVFQAECCHALLRAERKKLIQFGDAAGVGAAPGAS